MPNSYINETSRLVIRFYGYYSQTLCDAVVLTFSLCLPTETKPTIIESGQHNNTIVTMFKAPVTADDTEMTHKIIAANQLL